MNPASEPLRRFLETARGAGLHISAAESIDAARTVEVVGYADRDNLKNALGLVLAKTPDEKALYAEAFELYFRRERFDWTGDPSGSAPQTAATSALARMLEHNDSAGITAAVEAAAVAVGLEQIRYFTQGGLYTLRILRQAGLGALEDEITALRGSGNAQDAARAERIAGQVKTLRAAVRAYVDRHLEMFGRGELEAMHTDRLQAARLSGVSARDLERLRALTRRMARKLAARYARTRRRKLRGQLDIRRTIRRNVGWGGVPFVTHWKQRKIDKHSVLVLCDVSGSVADVSQFLLMFLYALNEALSDLRAFAFAGGTIDVSEILEREPVEQAIHRILDAISHQSSNYGNALAEFEAQWMKLITPKTTVIIVGDARGNNNDPRIDIFERISSHARRVIWLNPEHPASWGTGDSDMPRYAPFCSLLRECNSLRHLDRAIGQMLAQQG